MEEEVHVEDAEENPVVGRILEDIHERHSVVTESMYQDCFKLSLYVVKNNHEDSQLLVQSINWLLSVDLLLEEDQKQSNQNGAKVLDQEHSGPAHLWAKIFKEKDYFLVFDVLIQGSVFVLKRHASRLAYSESYSLRANISLC